MSETQNQNSIKSKNSSYQNLLEHKCELVVNTKDEQYSLNVSELVRDLYQKTYQLEARVAKLEKMAEDLKTGAAPDTLSS